MNNTDELYQLIIDHGHRDVYILCVMLSMLAGAFLIFKDSQTWPIDAQSRQILFRVIGLGSLIGCALPAYFAGGWVGKHAWDDFIGPKTILGGILFSCITTLIFKKYYRWNFETADAFARGGCLMMFIGRLGCIAQHCCFGIEVSSAYGFDFGDGHPRFPVQVLEAVGLFCLFVFIQWLHTNDYLKYRRLFIFFIFYGIFRFSTEFLREPIANIYWGIGFYQWLALMVMCIGFLQYIRVTHYLQAKDQREAYWY